MHARKRETFKVLYFQINEVTTKVKVLRKRKQDTNDGCNKKEFVVVTTLTRLGN